MGTNYYFRKKGVDPARIDAIFDELNNDYETLIKTYNEKLQREFSGMGIDDVYDIDERKTFYSPYDRDIFGDIHVGKLSAGWKPLMQANKQFSSIETLKLWYEKNKDEYDFIDEYDRATDFDDYIKTIAERNQDVERESHPGITRSDGYDWEYRQFS